MVLKLFPVLFFVRAKFYFTSEHLCLQKWCQCKMDDCYTYNDSDDKSEYLLDKLDNILYDEEDYVVENHGNLYCQELQDSVDLKVRNKRASWQRQTELEFLARHKQKNGCGRPTLCWIFRSCPG